MENKSLIQLVREYLDSRYDFRLDIVKSRIEFSLKGKGIWKQVNEDQLFIDIYENVRKCEMSSIISLLKSDFVKEYHPFREYFKSLGEWNGIDYIKEYCQYIDAVDSEDFYTQFKKWLVRTVKTAIEPKYFNKQAFIIVNPKQNTGKTSWCRNIVPNALLDYVSETFLPDKDGRIMLCRNLLINLDELEVLDRKEINILKSYFSKDAINERLPYDRKTSILPRTCSFIGSTNRNDFLNDETGSVRWLCFNVNSINFSYKTECDVDKIWQQAFHLSLDENFEYEMTDEELNTNEIRNTEFKRVSVEEELIMKYYETGNDNFLTATDIVCYLKTNNNLMHINPIAVGRVMQKLGFVREKFQNNRGYWLKIKSDIGNS
jgi:predicted P-loop ATPase